MTLDAVLTARDAASAFPSPLPAFTSSCAPSWTSPGRGAFLFFCTLALLGLVFLFKVREIGGRGPKEEGG